MINGAGKVGVSQIGPGGIIIGPGAPTVFVEGAIISTGLDTVTPHGENLHAKSTVTVATCSKTVFAMGKPVAKETGTVGSCLHPLKLGAVTVIVGL